MKQKFLSTYAQLFPQEDIREIEFIYDFASHQLPDDFARYLHTARLIMEELKWSDSMAVKTALLQKIIEKGNVGLFGGLANYQQTISKSLFRLSRIADPVVAGTVVKLTKPRFNGEFNTKGKINTFYLDQLQSDSRVLLIKAVDCWGKMEFYLNEEKARLLKNPRLTSDRTSRLFKKICHCYYPLLQKVLLDWEKDSHIFYPQLKRCLGEIETLSKELKKLTKRCSAWAVVEKLDNNGVNYYYLSFREAKESHHNTFDQRPLKIMVNPVFYKKLTQTGELPVRL